MIYSLVGGFERVYCPSDLRQWSVLSPNGVKLNFSVFGMDWESPKGPHKSKGWSSSPLFHGHSMDAHPQVLESAGHGHEVEVRRQPWPEWRVRIKAILAQNINIYKYILISSIFIHISLGCISAIEDKTSADMYWYVQYCSRKIQVIIQNWWDFMRFHRGKSMVSGETTLFVWSRVLSLDVNKRMGSAVFMAIQAMDSLTTRIVMSFCTLSLFNVSINLDYSDTLQIQLS